MQTALFRSTHCSAFQHSNTPHQRLSSAFSRPRPRRQHRPLVAPPQAFSSAAALDIGSPSNFQAITNIFSAALLGIGVWWYLKTQNNNEGQQLCPKCRGTGIVECFCKRWSDNDVGCGTCGGSGKMVCNSCNGGGTAVPIEAKIPIQQRRQIKDSYLPAQRQHTCKRCGQAHCQVLLRNDHPFHLNCRDELCVGELQQAGAQVSLKGINWFGFNNGSTMLDGLWGQHAMSKDFAAVVHRLKLLGFNAVRLPFSFQDLHNLPVRDWCGHWQPPTSTDIARSVTPPGRQLKPGHNLPTLLSPPARQDCNTCNDYLPSSSTYDRFCWVVHFFAHNSFFVLIDNHLREDQTALQHPSRWAQQWAGLVADLVKDSVTAEHLLVDVLNEPNNYGLRWEAAGSKPGLADLYLLAMDAIHQQAPGVPFFLEGTGQSGIGANWGDGFATDPGLIQSHGLSDPSHFFQKLATKPYAEQVVICPHVYGPAVTHSSPGATGQGLYQRLSDSFGYLSQQGLPGLHGQQIRFPIAIGEFGSKFEDPQDIQAMQDLASYLENKGPGADGKHRAIPHWFYWSWNANSGDTGGIVADDWTSIHWHKIEYLITCGLKPWYLDHTDSGQTSTAPHQSQTTAMAPEAPNMLAPPQQHPQQHQQLQQHQHQLQQPDQTPVMTGQQQPWADPSTSSEPNQAVPVQLWQGQPGSGTQSAVAVQAVVQVGQPWQSGPGQWQCDVNLMMTNKGQQTIPAPWQLAVHSGQYKHLVKSWCWQPTLTNGVLSGSASESWQTLASGAETGVGFVVECYSASVSRPVFIPEAVLLDGSACSVLSGFS